MRAILIDPFTRTVSEVEYSGSIEDIYRLTDCDTFTVATINDHNDGIFVDDEGLFKPDQAFFKHKNYPEPLAGKGLILGCDEDGESVEPISSLQDTIRNVKWVGNYELMKEAMR